MDVRESGQCDGGYSRVESAVLGVLHQWYQIRHVSGPRTSGHVVGVEVASCDVLNGRSKTARRTTGRRG